MDCSTPGFPVHHQIPESVMPSNHLIFCHPTISFSVIPFSCFQSFPSIRVFSSESIFSIKWPKNSRNVFFIALKAGKSKIKIKVPARLHSGESPLLGSYPAPSTQIVRDKGSFCFIKVLISFRRALLSRPNVELVEETHRYSNQSKMHGRKLESIHST